MKIKEVYIGNLREAFFEKNFNERFNIIYSDDNNKGKTIVIQAIMYCLGNNPVFPASFNYENYYFILTFDINGNCYDICRRKNSFIVKKNREIFIIDNISEFKRFWNKNINKLPVIVKDGKRRLADFELLVQVFFTGQDKKITHDILNGGWLKKADFINMLCSMSGIENFSDLNQSIDELKDKKNKLKTKKDLLLKKNKIIKKNNAAFETLSLTNKKIAIDEKLKEIEKFNAIIISLNSELTNAIKRKSKNELVLKELRSLNRTMNVGQIYCMDCGSNHISYESAESSFSFDISTSSMRTQIINSIQEKIDIYNEEIERLNSQISVQQSKMRNILDTEEVSIEELLIAKIDLLGTENDDKRISDLINEISNIDNQVKYLSLKNESIKNESETFLENLVNEMNLFNKYIDPSVSSNYDAIFTSRYKTHSGSEGTQFHLARMYAFSKVLDHNYPIIVDSFRAEDLSTEREKRVLEKFKEIKNQIIFTTTLKDEENLKYVNDDQINKIDYSIHENYKILQKKYVDDFVKKLNSMSIIID